MLLEPKDLGTIVKKLQHLSGYARGTEVGLLAGYLAGFYSITIGKAQPTYSAEDFVKEAFKLGQGNNTPPSREAIIEVSGAIFPLEFTIEVSRYLNQLEEAGQS